MPLTAPGDEAPAGSPEPLMLAGFRELIHNVHHVPGDDGGWWTWRCGVVYSRIDPGYLDGACQYDHPVHGPHAQMVAEAVAHLERWHDIRAADPLTGIRAGARRPRFLPQLFSAPRWVGEAVDIAVDAAIRWIVRKVLPG